MKRLALLALAPLLIAAGDPATESEHVVRSGETLNGIANRARVPAAVIAAANGLIEPYAVREGQRLTIPRQRIHVVKAGETAFAIAIRYGVSFENVAIANGLEAPYHIRTGQRLIIPAVIAAPRQPAPLRMEPYFRPPHDGEVVRGYAVRPDGGGHDGLDYAVAVGDMVRAAADGQVVATQADSPRFGRVVAIDHGRGWQSIYGHLARITVSVGDLVKAGERIGIAGDAGGTQRPELHFEIRHDERKIDPAEKLQPGSGA